MSKVVFALNDKGLCLKGARVLVIGVAYKADISDVRESPAICIIEELMRHHAVCSFSDEFVPNLTVSGNDLESVALDSKTVGSFDLVLLLTRHSGLDVELLNQYATLIVDTRGIFSVKPNRVYRA